MERFFDFCRARLLLTFLVFTASSIGAFAQGEGDSQRCSQQVSTSDSQCEDVNNCGQSTYCKVDTFTAQCTGNYTIDAWVTCAEGNCTDCKSCVKVYRFDSPFPVGQCSNETCSLGDCENTCTGAASLEQGRLYKLVVCLIPCTSDGNCNTCASTCQAWGCVRYAVIVPCWQ